MNREQYIEQDLKKFKIFTIREYLNEQDTSQVENVKLSIKDIDDEYIVLAKINNVIVGKLMFIKSKWKSILIASSVVVDPNYRRMGIATKMYNFAENKMNMDFRQNDQVLTPDGKLFWKSRIK